METNTRARRVIDPNKTPHKTSRGDPLLKPSDVGKALQLGRTQTWALLTSGAIPRVDVSAPGAKRASWRVRQSDLDAFLDTRAAAS